MKIKISCSVDSRIISEQFCHTRGDKEFHFKVNGKGFISSISLETSVPNPELFYSTISSSPRPGIAAHFNLATDNTFIETLIQEFQIIESHLTFQFEKTKINWLEPDVTLVPENELEKKSTKITSFCYKTDYPKETAKIPRIALANTLDYLPRYNDLFPILSLHNEAMEFYHSKRYITAFINFYFVIEVCFANGKTKNQQIEKEFLISKSFVNHLENVMHELSKDKQWLKKIESDLLQRQMSLTSHDLIKMIIKLRCDLSHFITTSKKSAPLPHYHQDYHHWATLLMGLSINTILFKVLDINKECEKKMRSLGSS